VASGGAVVAYGLVLLRGTGRAIAPEPAPAGLTPASAVDPAEKVLAAADV
jgi:hypothetical protein